MNRDRVYFLFFCMVLMCTLLHCAAGADSSYRNKWAILVGIDEYQDQNLADLKGAVKDVYNVKSVLINDCGVPYANICNLTGSQATKANIRNAIYQLSQKASPDDLVIFFYSGHGGPMSQDFFAVDEDDGVDELITAYDTTVYGGINTISDDELQTWFNNVQSQNTVFIINSCFNGGIAKSGSPQSMNTSIQLNENNEGEVSKDFQRDINTAKYLVLMASSDDEYSWTTQEGSFFPHFFVEGLQSASADTDADSWISLEEAFWYAKPRTTAIMSSQHPTIFDGNPYAEIDIVPIISPAPTPIPSDSSFKNKWALLIGVRDYQNLNDLVNPLNDVQDFESILLNKCGFSSNNILTYTDSQATKSNIKDAMYQLSQMASPEDLVVFFFSGHGDYMSYDFSPVDEIDGKDEFIAPYDVQIDGGNYLNAISDDELQFWFDTVNSHNTVIILDSCRSGGITKSLVRNEVEPKSATTDIKGSQTRDIKRDINSNKYLVLMAADDVEKSSDGDEDLKNGLFTYYLIEGLSTKSADIDKDSWISFEEAFSYAKPLIVNYPDGNSQTPQLFDGNTDTEIDIVHLPTIPEPTSSYYEFLQAWGIKGVGEGQFNYPWGIAVHPTNDRVYVPDPGNNRIQVFSKTGSYITSWGEYGSQEMQFNYPNGIALNDHFGRVYVSERNGNRVQIFSEEGDYLTCFGNDFWFVNMGDIHIDSTTGDVYVADTGHHRIEVFDRDGNFIREWGAIGTGEGLFQSPVDVAVNQDTRRVYVSDQDNNRIQVFNEMGWYITQFGTYGAANGQFDRPGGIALNASGYLFVVDRGNNRIQVFLPNGEYVTGWGSPGSGIGQFDTPSGIDVDPITGCVYVADSNNNRVQVFAPKFSETPLPTPTSTTPTPTPTPTPTSTSVTPTPTQPGSTLQADFSASPASGIAPLTVRFQDASQGNPTGWMWDVNGDGFQDYTENGCEHTYTAPGYYTVTLSITRNQELVMVSRPGYIHVLSGTPTSETVVLDLFPGWNYISTPGTLAEDHRTMSEVFSGVDTAGHSTFEYNAQAQSWTQLNPDDEIEPLQGIWIYSGAPAEVPLVLSDDPISSNSMLSPGWNSIGFSQVVPVPAKDALLPVRQSWSQLIGYNAEYQFYETSIINGGTGTQSDTNLVYPGKGYWIFMNNQGTLT